MKIIIRKNKFIIPIFIPNSLIPIKRIINKMFIDNNIQGNSKEYAKIIRKSLKMAKKYHKGLCIVHVIEHTGSSVVIRL